MFGKIISIYSREKEQHKMTESKPETVNSLESFGRSNSRKWNKGQRKVTVSMYPQVVGNRTFKRQGELVT